MKRVKKHISDSHLEEKIINLLKEKVEKSRFNIEDFSFASILKELQAEYDVSKNRLKRMLNKLEKEDLITIKSRYFNVYIPKGFEKKFVGLVDKIDPFTIPVIIMITGYYVLILVLSIILSYSKLEMVISLNSPNGLLSLLYVGLVTPLVLGTIVFLVAKKIWNILYKNIKFLREMIEFFGGIRVCKYALFFAIIFLMIYIFSSIFTNNEINPYFAVAIFSGIFMGVLYYGKRK